jgi:hypothetical protein
MSDNGSDRAVFVFDPDASYGFVREIRDAGVMPTPGLRYVAAVTGPWKIIKVIGFRGVEQLLERLNAPGDDTATSFRPAKVRRSHYRVHTAFVRIETDVAIRTSSSRGRRSPRHPCGRLRRTSSSVTSTSSSASDDDADTLLIGMLRAGIPGVRRP